MLATGIENSMSTAGAGRQLGDPNVGLRPEICLTRCLLPTLQGDVSELGGGTGIAWFAYGVVSEWKDLPKLAALTFGLLTDV
jgi:hypothetical protein